ncbi:MAG: four helix bundle protein [Ignavibacteriales bacterium]|nr:four helix bundle protein [Ignavibacteriales bacterium]
MEKSHKKLDVWLKSFELTKSIYAVTKKFPSEEKYGLVSQMRRAAVSIPSNIAEGSARQTKKDALYLFVVARGSLSELDTQIELSRSLEMINDADYQLLTNQINSVDSLLSGFIRYRRSRN